MKKKFLTRLGGGAMALLLICVFYLTVIMAETGEASSEWVVQDDAEAIESIGHVRANDISSLRSTFGATLIALPASYNVMSGEVYDASYGGENARMISVTYPDIEIHAVRPVKAGALVKRNDLNAYLNTEISLLGFRCLYSAKGSTQCLTFQTDSAVYTVTSSTLSQEAFIALAQQLQVR